MIIDHYEADTLTIEIPVTDEATGSLKVMAGGAVVALARPVGGGDTVTLPSAIDGSSVIVDIAANGLTAQTWQVQARVTLAADIQTVANFTLRSLVSFGA